RCPACQQVCLAPATPAPAPIPVPVVAPPPAPPPAPPVAREEEGLVEVVPLEEEVARPAPDAYRLERGGPLPAPRSHPPPRPEGERGRRKRDRAEKGGVPLAVFVGGGFLVLCLAGLVVAWAYYGSAPAPSVALTTGPFPAPGAQPGVGIAPPPFFGKD